MEARSLFERHSDKFKRLNLGAFLAALKEYQTDAGCRNTCCLTVADPTLPHSEHWPELHANGKTAREKRELSNMIAVLRVETQRLAPFEHRCSELSNDRDALQRQAAEMRAEMEQMRQQLREEREWLETQLATETNAQAMEQAQLRRELAVQQQTEREAKATLRAEMEEQLRDLREALTSQQENHARMMAEERKVVAVLHEELEELETVKAGLEERLRLADVDRLRAECARYQQELTTKTQELCSQLSQSHEEYRQMCAELDRMRTDLGASEAKCSAYQAQVSVLEAQLSNAAKELHSKQETIAALETGSSIYETVDRREYKLPVGYALVPI